MGTKVVSTGSILRLAQPGDTVWGSGLARPAPVARDVHITAVRGPLTRDEILRQGGTCPAVYGDPALLFNRLFVRPSPQPSPLVVVPHYRDYAQAREMLRGQAIPLVDLLKPPHAVLQAITSAEVVYSSSLHGIIVAEALGVPAIWVEFGERVIGGGFKFRDYYLASGRAPPPPLDWRRRISFTSCREAPEIQYPDLDALLRAAYQAMPVRSGEAAVPGQLVL